MKMAEFFMKNDRWQELGTAYSGCNFCSSYWLYMMSFETYASGRGERQCNLKSNFSKCAGVAALRRCTSSCGERDVRDIVRVKRKFVGRAARLSGRSSCEAILKAIALSAPEVPRFEGALRPCKRRHVRDIVRLKRKSVGPAAQLSGRSSCAAVAEQAVDDCDGEHSVSQESDDDCSPPNNTPHPCLTIPRASLKNVSNWSNILARARWVTRKQGAIPTLQDLHAAKRFACSIVAGNSLASRVYQRMYSALAARSAPRLKACARAWVNKTHGGEFGVIAAFALRQKIPDKLVYRVMIYTYGEHVGAVFICFEKVLGICRALEGSKPGETACTFRPSKPFKRCRRAAKHSVLTQAFKGSPQFWNTRGFAMQARIEKKNTEVFKGAWRTARKVLGIAGPPNPSDIPEDLFRGALETLIMMARERQVKDDYWDELESSWTERNAARAKARCARLSALALTTCQPCPLPRLDQNDIKFLRQIMKSHVIHSRFAHAPSHISSDSAVKYLLRTIPKREKRARRWHRILRDTQQALRIVEAALIDHNEACIEQESRNIFMDILRRGGRPVEITEDWKEKIPEPKPRESLVSYRKRLQRVLNSLHRRQPESDRPALHAAFEAAAAQARHSLRPF